MSRRPLAWVLVGHDDVLGCGGPGGKYGVTGGADCSVEYVALGFFTASFSSGNISIRKISSEPPKTHEAQVKDGIQGEVRGAKEFLQLVFVGQAGFTELSPASQNSTT